MINKDADLNRELEKRINSVRKCSSQGFRSEVTDIQFSTFFLSPEIDIRLCCQSMPNIIMCM